MAIQRHIDAILFRVSPMLATLADRPFHKEGWVYEAKYDGIRVLAYKEGSHVSLLTRNGKERSGKFPEIVEAIKRLNPRTLVLDGEIVVFDSHEVSRFQFLQRGKGPARYVVFDCLYVNGEDLRTKALSIRRQALERAVKPSEFLLTSARLAEDGLRAFQVARRRRLEGLIARIRRRFILKGVLANGSR